MLGHGGDQRVDPPLVQLLAAEPRPGAAEVGPGAEQRPGESVDVLLRVVLVEDLDELDFEATEELLRERVLRGPRRRLLRQE